MRFKELVVPAARLCPSAICIPSGKLHVFFELEGRTELYRPCMAKKRPR
jgi:hypothetical protein